MMKKQLLIFLFLMFNFSVFAQSQYNTDSVDEQVKSIVSQMSTDEKIAQLSTFFGWEMYKKENNTVNLSKRFIDFKNTPGMLWGTLRADPWTQITLQSGLTIPEAVEVTNKLQHYAINHSRFHIPIFLAEEGAHGEMAIGTTVFPTGIGQASTWDTALIRQMGEAIAAETRSQGSHIVYGPILDLARDPRWSRVEETYGEDPELVAQMGVAMVKGLQNGPFKVISTLKHFAAYGMSDGGQNGGRVTLGKRDLLEDILYPFKAAVKAGAGSLMAAYNSIDGIPCSANKFLLTDLLHNQWGFKGFTVSDLGSIDALISISGSPQGAAAAAMDAGLYADLGGGGYGKNLKLALKENLISVAQLDTAVSRLLKAKFELGLFKNPYVNKDVAMATVRNAKHIALARKVADESIILLKNDTIAGRPVLPLSKKIKRIAVIGPNANNIYNQIGDYSAPQEEANIVTTLKGIRNKMPNSNVQYVKACDIRDTGSNQINEAVEAVKNSDVAIIVLGGSSARDFKTSYEKTGAASVQNEKSKTHISDMESGEGFDRATLTMMGLQMNLLKAVATVGKPVILVTIEGRPLNLDWASKNISAILQAWYPGQQGGNAVADVLFGDYNPAGRLPISVPRSVGQLPVYYNYRGSEKHPYVEELATPLYSFGYGLSYSKFIYSNLSIKNNQDTANPIITVSFTVTNQSKVAGDEVPQLYIHQKYASTERPIKQLRAFERIHLNTEESKEIIFHLTKEEVQSWTSQEKWQVEKSPFEILVGASSDDIRLRGVTKF